MSVSDGQPVNASVTNAAYLSRLSDSDTVGEIDLKNVSYTDLISLQRVINEALSSLGMANQAATDAAADDYSSNNVVTNGDNRKVAIGKLDAEFDGTTGHTHDGTAGQGPKVSAANLDNFNNLFAEFGEYTFDAASGTSIDVTSLFTGQTAGGDAVTEGVITSAPNNYIPIVEKTNGGEIEDPQGDRVYGRLTESGGTWTLSFFTNEAGTETAHTLSSQNIRFLYREVFTAANRPTIGANVAVYDTQSAIGDIPDASGTQRGVVSTSAQTFAGAKDFTTRPTINSNDVVDVNQTQTLTNKDYDGGTASNTSRVTLPKNTTANLTGLTRKEGTVFYDTTEQNFFGDNGTDIIPLGGGAGGGGLDVWHTEDFESTVAADFTSSNDPTFGTTGTAFAGALADETVSPIASDSSLKYTQASGSLDDWFKSPVIAIDDKQSGNTSGITLYFTYDGDPDDIQFVFYDETNSSVLTATQDTFTTQSNPTRYSTSVSIPSTTTSVSWGAQVKVENIGAVLVIDDVEFSTDPFIIQDIVTKPYAFRAQNTGSTPLIGSAETDIILDTDDNSVSPSFDEDSLYDTTTGRYTIPEDGYYYFAWNGLLGNAVNENYQLRIRRVSDNLEIGRTIQNGSSGRYVQCEGVALLNVGDEVKITSDSATDVSYNFQQGSTFYGYKLAETSPALVTPSKANLLEWTAFTPTGTWSNTSYTGFYRRVGDSMDVYIEAGVNGAVGAVNLEVDIPSGFTIDFAKLPATTSRQILGNCSWYDSVSTQVYGGQVVWGDPNTVQPRIIRTSGTAASALTPVNNTDIWTKQNGDFVYIRFSVPIVGWDAESQFLAAIPFDEWQTKELQSDQTASGTLSDMTFNNLVIGKEYQFLVQAYFSKTVDQNTSVTVVHNGSTIGRVNHNPSSATSGNGLSAAASGKFTATATTLTFTAGGLTGSAQLLGDGTMAETFAQLTELNFSRETTRFT